MRMLSLLKCLKLCLHACDGSLWLLKHGRAMSAGMVNLQPLCTLLLHRPDFSWTATVYHFSNDTASGLLKMPAVNRGCFGAVSRAAHFSLCVPVLSLKSAVLARNSSPSHHPPVIIVEQPESTQPASSGVKPNGNLCSRGAAQPLGKLWMSSPWGTRRAAQYKPCQNSALQMTGHSAPAALC